jgi:hypothetical protein
MPYAAELGPLRIGVLRVLPDEGWMAFPQPSSGSCPCGRFAHYPRRFVIFPGALFALFWRIASALARFWNISRPGVNWLAHESDHLRRIAPN